MKSVDLKSVEDFSVRIGPTVAPMKTRLYNRVGKRVFDLLLAAALLPFVGPALVLLAIVVRTDGGLRFMFKSVSGGTASRSTA